MKKAISNMIKVVPFMVVFGGVMAAENNVWEGWVRHGEFIDVESFREKIECPDGEINTQLRVVSPKIEYNRWIWLDAIGERNKSFMVTGGIKETTPPEIVKEIAGNYRFAIEVSCSTEEEAL